MSAVPATTKDRLTSGFQPLVDTNKYGSVEEARNSEKAFQDFLERNLGLVKKIIMEKLAFLGISRYQWELFQAAGVEALVQAIERYDRSKGQFSTFAWFGISRAIDREIYKLLINTGISERAWHDLRQIIKICDSFYAEFGRQPTPQEISSVSRDADLTPARVSSVLEQAVSHISLDSPRYNQESERTTYGDTLPGLYLADAPVIRKEEAAVKEKRRQQFLGGLGVLLEKLIADDRKVFMLKFYLDEENGRLFFTDEWNEPRNNVEIGKMMGVTNSCIGMRWKRIMKEIGKDLEGLCHLLEPVK